MKLEYMQRRTQPSYDFNNSNGSMKVESGMQNIMQRVKKKNMDAILYGHKFINHNNSNESLVKGQNITNNTI